MFSLSFSMAFIFIYFLCTIGHEQMKFMKRELEHNVDNTEPKKEIGTIDPNFWFNSKKKYIKNL